MILYDHHLKNYTFNIETVTSHHKGKDGKYKKEKYCNNIFTFDIECTSAWLENNKVIGYTVGKDTEYWNSLQSLALCYLWQFSVDGVVYYGRELRDFKVLLSELPEDVHIIIWVHNLSYEFQFLCNILHFNKVFARSPHKPMKASAEEYPYIEYRCSYFLTRLSLESWGKQLGVYKAVGQLDYDKLRTPLTPLTDKELEYGEMDCLVVDAGIKYYLKKYKKQRKIPLTQTGTVRKEVKDLLTSDKYYVRQVKKLVPKSVDEYKRLRNVFAGGYTHANNRYAGYVVTDHIEHYDFASSYPTVMIAEKYPMSRWYYNGVNEIPDDSVFENMAFIFLLEFIDINSNSFNTYIQTSKCITHGFCNYDNGRILHADQLEIYVTEQDYITIRNNYTWKQLTVKRVWRCKKDYLPRAFTNYILDLYANKTELKNVSGKEDLYLQSKQYINSMYGMSVTALIQADVIYDGSWSIKPLTANDVQKKLKTLSNYHDREKRYFLSYSWGCWVTAYARRNLWKCIESCDHDVLYCDTDSIFVRGFHDFTWYNEDITKKLKTACDDNNLDFNKTRPCTPAGLCKPLGIFEKEDDCIEFKTLGAKRYVEKRSDGKLYLTVSGINKSAVQMLKGNIDAFRDGFNFDKDDPSVKKKLCTYLDDMPIVTYPDGYVSTYKYGINLRNAGYLLTMTDEYKDLIKYMQYDITDLPETYVNHLRGTWIEEDLTNG